MTQISKKTLKSLLIEKTGCSLQHTGWPCGTCFFDISETLDNSDWQSLLYFRGDYKKKELNNLPENYMENIEKIYNLIK
jgi:hypothetical protein